MQNSNKIQKLPIIQPSGLYVLLLCIVGFLAWKEETIGTEISISILAVVSFILFPLSIFLSKKIYYPKKVTLLFGLLLVWACVSSYFSKDSGSAVWEMLKMSSLFILFVSVYSLSKINPGSQKIIPILFVAIGTALLLHDFLLYITSSDFRNGVYFIGSYYWHNQMAGFLLFLIPILLSVALAVKKNAVKIVLLLFAVFYVFAMIKTHSVGGWASLSGSMALFAFLYRKQARFITLFLILPLFALFLIIPITGKQGVGVKQVQNIQSELLPQTRTVSGNLRITVWKNSLRMVKNYPIVGVGPGAFGELYYAFQTDPWLYARYAHNHFLLMASELGIPGLALFLGILVLSILSLYKGVLLEKHTNLYTIGIVSALFGSVLHSFIDVDWSTISLYSLFWIFLSVSLAQISKTDNIIQFSKKQAFLFFIPILFIGVAFLLLIAEKRFKQAEQYVIGDQAKKAEKEITIALSINKLDARYYSLLGRIQDSLSKRDSATNSFRRAIELSPFNSEYYYSLGNISLAQKDYQNAKILFAKAVFLNPYSHPKLYVALADAYLNLGNQKEAKKVLQECIYKAFPLNDSYRGFEYLYKATGFNKDLAIAYVRLFLLDMKMGNKPEAKKLLTVVEKDLDPQNPLLPFFKSYVAK